MFLLNGIYSHLLGKLQHSTLRKSKKGWVYLLIFLESRVSLEMCWIQSWYIMYLCWGKDCWTRIRDWEPLVQNWVSPAVPTVMVVRRSSTEKIVVPAEPGLFFSVDRAQTIHRQGSTLSLTTWVLFTSSSYSLLYIVHEISLSALKKTDVWQPIFSNHCDKQRFCVI